MVEEQRGGIYEKRVAANYGEDEHPRDEMSFLGVDLLGCRIHEVLLGKCSLVDCEGTHVYLQRQRPHTYFLTHIVLLNINRQSQSSYACQMDYLGGICEKRKSFAVHEELTYHHDLRSGRYLLLSLGRCKELPNPRHRENPAVVQLFISWLCGTVVGWFQHSSL